MNQEGMNPILTDEELITIADDDQFWDNHFGYQECDAYALAKAIEQAVLNKLSEQKPVCYGNQTALDNMLDDRVAEVAGVRDGWRKTPLYLHPAPSVPEGYQLVPIEPTEAMQEAWDGESSLMGTWNAMLAAARSE